VALLGVTNMNFENSQLNYSYSINYPIKIKYRIPPEVPLKIMYIKNNPPKYV
jgi:hypothetical protein